jgi:hypothetical protein
MGTNATREGGRANRSLETEIMPVAVKRGAGMTPFKGALP